MAFIPHLNLVALEGVAATVAELQEVAEGGAVGVGLGLGKGNFGIMEVY